MRKILLIIYLFCTPFLTLGQEMGKKTFFAGRSFYFWLLIALTIYFIYLYLNSRDKKKFIKSPVSIIVATSITLFTSAFLYVNIFLSDERPNTISDIAQAIPFAELLKQEQLKMQEAEQNFTNIDLHYDLIKQHFTIPNSWDENNKRYYRDDYEMTNFYYDHLFFSDSLYVNIGRLGMGIISYHRHEYSLALNYLLAISCDTLPYTNSYLAKSYLMLGDTASAIYNFEEACTRKNKEYNSNIENLVNLYSLQNLDDKLLGLAINPETHIFIPKELAQRLFFTHNHLLLYAYEILQTISDNFKITGLIAAIGILIIWLIYIVRLDIFERENILHLLMVLLGGMLFSLLVFYISDFLEYNLNFRQGEDSWDKLLFFILKVGGVEEMVKFLPVFLLLAIAPGIVNEPYDYILYAAVSALGFSFVENLLYFNGSLNGIVHGRAFTSVPMHMFNSSVAAYGLVLSLYRYRNLSPAIGFTLFFILASIAHGLYDFFLHEHLFVYFMFLFVLSISVWIVIINNCLNNSPSFSYRKKLHPAGVKLFFALAMLSILILQYLVVAWENGPSVANNTFNSHLIIGGILIIYYADRLTSMDLVKGYWSTIPLRTIHEIQEGESFDLKHFFIRIIAGNTMPHAFVGARIKMLPDPSNAALGEYYNEVVNGEIYDRIVVNCVSRKTGEQYKDPYWFRLRTEKAIYTGANSVDMDFIFKFDNNYPSFRKEKYLFIHLYVVKYEENSEDEFIRKNNLRPLGTAVLTAIS